MADTADSIIDAPITFDHVKDAFEPGRFFGTDTQSEDLIRLTPSDLKSTERAKYQSMANALGFTGDIPIFLDSSNKSAEPQASFITTISGSHAIIINDYQYHSSLTGVPTKPSSNAFETQTLNQEKLSPDDMTPQSRTQYQKLAKSLGITGELPVYLDTSDNIPIPKTTFITTPHGEHALVINSKAHQWSESFVRKQMFSDNEIKNMVANKNIIPITQTNCADFGMTKEVLQEYANMAKSMGLTQTPVIYSNPPIEYAGNERTLDGTPLISANPSYLKSLSHDQQIGMLGHELAHLANGDGTPERIALAHNSDKVARNEEFKADSKSCYPASTENVLQSDRKNLLDDFKKEWPKEPVANFDAYISLVSTNHPTDKERIARLKVEEVTSPDPCGLKPLPSPAVKASSLNLPPK